MNIWKARNGRSGCNITRCIKEGIKRLKYIEELDEWEQREKNKGVSTNGNELDWLLYKNNIDCNPIHQTMLITSKEVKETIIHQI